MVLAFSCCVSAALVMLSGVNALPQPEEGALSGRVVTTSCNPGSYHNTTTMCTVCPAGSSCDGTSGKSQQCNPGSYQPNKNSTSCIVTAAGYYTNQKGATQAIACSTGSYQSNKNSTSCVDTPAGYYTNQVAATKAIACSPGSYQPNKKSNSCIATTSGYYTSLPGSIAAVPAIPGFFTNSTGAIRATPCSNETFCYGAPSGRFQGFSGQAAVCGTCCGWAAPLVNNNVNPVNCTGSKPNAWPASGDGCIASATNCVHAKTCVQFANGTCPAETFTG
ncbi:hypothetical protein C8F04DRAFT_1172935 [Mycena alexandri]|uniref:Uncharacterized protein n=1 Tax=Mycena alexandri TaxID=1745969 RepID=A0AAD6TKV3_9AGAR|nr:hypothetical protein C8F04DRAFT_1172935 [Mycena alexandri]